MSAIENSATKSLRTAPPDGLTEIRVHGVGGTPPSELLNDISPERVAGDRIAGFYRTSDHLDRHREAYSWGGLTSHSPLRSVLWIPMLPSMLTNMAGWMARRYVTSGDEEKAAAPTTKWFRYWARLAAFALTLNTAVLVTMLSLDTFAYQCLGQHQCRSQMWEGLNLLLPYERPGVRLAVGVIPPVAAAALFFALSSLSRTRYEGIEPPTPTDSTPRPERLCAAAQAGGLRHPGFWSGYHWHRHLSRLHLAAVIAVSTGMLSLGVIGLGGGMRLPSNNAVLCAQLAGIASVFIVFVVLGMLASDKARERLALATLAATGFFLIVAFVAACILPLELIDAEDGGKEVRQPSGVAPGIDSVITFSWLIPALLVPLILQQVIAWGARWRRAMQGTSRRRNHGLRNWFKSVRAEASGSLKVFPFAAPVVLNVVALIFANAVLLSLLIMAAEGLGEVRYGFGLQGGAAGTETGDAVSPVLWVPKAMVSTAAALVLGLGFVLLFFALAALAALIFIPQAMAPRVMQDLKDEYGKTEKDAATFTKAPAKRPRKEAWNQSAFGLDPSAPHPSKWVHKVARARLIASCAPNVTAILMITIAVVCSVGAALVIVYDWDPPMWVVDLVTWLGVATPLVYAAVIRTMFRQENVRKVLMTPFDVGTFFPRSFHPFAPPSYTERAAPELTRRIWFLHDFGDRVVLTAHSQGSALAAAVLARQTEEPDQEKKPVGLVTLGSPLSKLYRWAFPALFSDGLLQSLAEGRGGFGPIQWCNVYYQTDYIGGPISRDAWSAEQKKIDRSLSDPPTHWYVYPVPLPTILSHTGYWCDDNFWQEVNRMCNRIRRSPSAAPPTTTPPSAPKEVPIPPDPRVPVPYR